MFMRSGDPLPVRLAQGIYAIIDVAEGGDPCVLKFIISVSRSRNASMNRTNMGTGSDNRVTQRCNCAADITLLKDSIASLQAEHVLLKQTIHVSDTLRSKQIDAVKNGLSDIKSQLLTFTSSLIDCTYSTERGMQNIVNSAAKQLLSVEDRVRWIESVLDTDNVAVVRSLPCDISQSETEMTRNLEAPREMTDRLPIHKSERCSMCDNDLCDNIHVGDICFPQLRLNVLPVQANDSVNVNDDKTAPPTSSNDVGKRFDDTTGQASGYTAREDTTDTRGRGVSCTADQWVDTWQAPRVPRKPVGRPIPVRVTTRRVVAELPEDGDVRPADDIGT